ncbi:MAG: hypothetical protein LBB05_01230 [Puniceicoccales bacterium]|jgi:hypothetical protein|nr:hypothetical protein [Puniceicoccales bacterium]
MKSKLSVKNENYGVLASFFLLGFSGNVPFLLADPEAVANVGKGAVNDGEKQVARARKILNEALFEAID